MKKLSLLAVIIFVFTALTACGKPADADELLQFGLEAASEVESSSSDINASISVGGMSYELTGSMEYVKTPEAAIKATINILDSSITLTYTGGKLYVGDKEAELTEEQKTTLDETLAKDVSYDTLISYILPDSLSYVENDGSYTLSFSLDPALSKEFIVEKLKNSPLLTEEELAAISGTEINTDTISVGEISFEFELDEKDFNVISSNANIIIQIGEKELEIAASSSNYVYNEITEIPAP